MWAQKMRCTARYGQQHPETGRPERNTDVSSDSAMPGVQQDGVRWMGINLYDWKPKRKRKDVNNQGLANSWLCASLHPSGQKQSHQQKEVS